jgi:ammonia channel protein AmtB
MKAYTPPSTGRPVPLWAKFFFQLVFAGTAATIVSGAVAERIKFSSFLVFSFLLVAFMYTRLPATGSGAAASWA